MQLTSIQYNAIMMAINNAKEMANNGEFLDPYTENPDGYTNQSLLGALNQVENMIIANNLPY
jgi:hypothetical protein